MATEAYLTLNTGAKMPIMAFGTLMESLEPNHESTVRIIENALDVGYKHIDTARLYGTEKMIGEALQNKIRDGLLKREDVFITTKLWRNSFAKEDVVPALKRSLADLQLEYVDLFLVHWPTAFKSADTFWPKNESGKLIYAAIDYLETWKGMEECYKLGLTKAIGLSNFNSKQITRILENCKVEPANHQIECHPHLTNTKLVEFCQNKGITVFAYSPLGGSNPNRSDCPTIYTDPIIKEIAQKHKKSEAQVALRFQIQRNVGVAPKSSKLERMKQNFEVLEFKLSEEDMKKIESCNRNYRLNDEFPDHPYYPFNEEY